MENTTQNTGLTLHLSTTDLQSAGAVFQEGQLYLEKYTAKQAELIQLAQQTGEKLPKEIDDQLMQWQVSAKKAVKYIEEKRKPYTEKAHAFIKAFTSIENTLSKELYDPIQQIRDKSAKIHAQEAAAAAQKEREALAAKQRRIDEIAALETQLRNGYSTYLTSVKQTLLTAYSNCTLESFADAQAGIRNFIGGTLSDEAWLSISLVGDADLVQEVRTAEKFNACAIHFTAEVTKYAEYLLSLMPARKSELEAGQAQSKAVEELKRKQEEEAAALQAAAAKKAEEEAIKAKQSAAVTVQINQANREVDAPKTVESYAVEVTTVDGWRSLIDFYLTNSGVSVDDLGKVKLDQMKAFAEKQAKVTSEMVTSDGVHYEPKYKAVARASAKGKAA